MRTRLLFTLFLLLASCSREQPKHVKGETSVTAYTVNPLTIPTVFTFVGRTESSHLVEIRARVEGYLQEIAFQEGSMVKEGELLFQLDPRSFQAALDSAAAELNQQKALLWRAERDAERLKPLYEQKAASKKDLDAATSQVLATQAAVDSAAARVEEAKLNLSYTRIQAPSSGLTSLSNYRLGALITPGNQSLLTTISSVDPIWVMFSISENELLKSRLERASNCLVFPEKMDFNVHLELGFRQNYKEIGKVDFANPSFDPTTGMQQMRAVFPNPKGELRPGQFVRVHVAGAKRPGAMLVPKQAVLQGNSGFYVFVIGEGEKVEVRSIEVGDWYESFWIIRGGLEKGEKVVVNGVNKIEPGTKVQIEAMVEPPKESEPYLGPACIMKEGA